MRASAQGSLTSNGRWNRSCRTGTHCFLVVQPEAGDATGSMDGSELERRERASRLRRTHKNRFDRALDSVRDINSIPRTRAGRGRGAGPLRPVRSDLFHPDRGGVNMPTCEDQSTGPHSNPFCIPYLALLGASAMPGPDTNSQNLFRFFTLGSERLRWAANCPQSRPVAPATNLDWGPIFASAALALAIKPKPKQVLRVQPANEVSLTTRHETLCIRLEV